MEYTRSQKLAPALVIVCVVLLILISACTQQQTFAKKGTPPPLMEKKFPEPPKPREICEGIICQPDRVCQNDQCVCKDGTKECNGKCISILQCCSDSDCGPSATCEAGTCKDKCAGVLCSFNQQCIPATGQCECLPNLKWCPSQNKCINRDGCCQKSDCANTRTKMACTPTQFVAKICIQESTNVKSCKPIAVGDTSISLPVVTGSLKIQFIQVYQNKIFDLLVQDRPFNKVALDHLFDIGGGRSLFITDFKQIGGDCRITDRNRLSSLFD